MAEEHFAIEPGRTKVSVMKVENGPLRAGDFSALAVGRGVVVWPKDGLAAEIRVMPPSPVIGILKELSGTRLTLRPTTRPGEAVISRSFAIDLPRTEYFEEYFGQPAEPTTRAELQVGETVAITAENTTATGVTVMHPAIYGQLSSVGDNSFSVTLKGGKSEKVFVTDATTIIYLGKEDHLRGGGGMFSGGGAPRTSQRADARGLGRRVEPNGQVGGGR